MQGRAEVTKARRVESMQAAAQPYRGRVHILTA